MYEISALYFINYLPTATSPQSTQTATAAMSAAPTGKKIESFINNTTVIKSDEYRDYFMVNNKNRTNEPTMK